MNLSNFLRKIKLLYLADFVQFRLQKFQNRKENKTFTLENPNVKLPPDYLMYESFQVNYRKYFKESKKGAEEIVEYLKKYIGFQNKKILDWGCGPGRIIRHLPEILGPTNYYYGTDYNNESITWCKNNLPGIDFNHNGIDAILPYEDNFFDALYGLSIFTHLSEPMHYSWMKELTRVLKPGGIMLITTQSNSHAYKLDASERKQYEAGKLVVRGQVKEGHRTYSAFQPVPFMKELYKNMEIVAHIIREPTSRWDPQDIWITRKV